MTPEEIQHRLVELRQLSEDAQWNIDDMLKDKKKPYKLIAVQKIVKRVLDHEIRVFEAMERGKKVTLRLALFPPKKPIQ